MRIKTLLILVSIVLFLWFSLMSLGTFSLAISGSVIQNCKYVPNSIEIHKQFELFTDESWVIIINRPCIVKIHLSFFNCEWDKQQMNSWYTFFVLTTTEKICPLNGPSKCATCALSHGWLGYSQPWNGIL